MITLRTPGTGFDDFESRIALGLCRVALDCVEPEQVTLEESFDRYLVHVDIDEKENVSIGKSLAFWGIKVLSSEDTMNRIPGFRAKEIYDRKNKKGKLTIGYSRKMSNFSQKLFNNPMASLSNYLTDNLHRRRKGSHASSCGHDDSDAIFNAILGMSPQIGKPYKRDNITNQQNLHLCASCGALGLLGTISFQTDVPVSRNGRLTKEKYFFMPRFRGKTFGDALSSYIATVKHVQPRLKSIPANTALLALLSSHPHLCRTIQEHLTQPALLPTFFVASAEKDDRGTSRFQYLEEKVIDAELMFLGANPYNVALAQNAYRHAEDSLELLNFLSILLRFKRNQDTVSFCREYVSVTKGKQLVYKESVEYIAKEVLGMDENLICDPNIKAVATMLKFFVRDRRFGYVDYLRGSENISEFTKKLYDAHRDASSIFYKPDDKKTKEEKYLSLPSEDKICEFLKLLNAEDKFEQVKILTCLLAFTQ